MKKEKSCGAIVYKKIGGKIKILMVKHVNGGHWSFPKGHVEHDETEVQTALREIKEETGLSVKIDTGFKQIVTYSPKKDVIKDVVFFAAIACDENFTRQEIEIEKIVWADLDKAQSLVSFENDKTTIKEFTKYVISEGIYEGNV